MIAHFADTSLVNPRDELHSKARSVSREFASARVITSEMILTELLNGFSEGGSWLRGGAARAVEALRGNQGIRIVPQTTEQFRNALRHYEQFKDKSWSRVRGRGRRRGRRRGQGAREEARAAADW